MNPSRINSRRTGQWTPSLFLSMRQISQRMVIIMVLCLGFFAVVGYLFVNRELNQARRHAFGGLEAIAELKAEQISNWRRERQSEATFLMHTPAIATDIAALLAEPDNPDMRNAVRGWLEQIKISGGYNAVALLDPLGRIRFSSPAQIGDGVPAPLKVSQALATGVVSQMDLHRHGDREPPHLTQLVPILSQPEAGGQTQPIALVMLRLDPARFLYPLIQSWPVPSATAESLLVRREGDEVVFLNELRHQSGAALTLRLPIDDPLLPAARALRGETGVIAGRDYRDVEVLSVGLVIPDSPWILIAKVDESEIAGPIRNEVLKSTLLVGTLALVVILGGGV